MTTSKPEHQNVENAARSHRFWKWLHLATVFLWGMSLAFLVRALDRPSVRGRWWYAATFVGALFLSILWVFDWAQRHEKWLLKERHDELAERRHRDSPGTGKDAGERL